MKKRFKILLSTIAIALLLTITGCASCQRSCKDFSSDMEGGLPRIINVYNFDGTLLATYEGTFDLPVREDARVEFEYNGKRIIYYNAIVEIIEK